MLQTAANQVVNHELHVLLVVQEIQFHQNGKNDVFAWKALEPEEGVYTFEWLDETMDRMALILLIFQT